MVWGFNELILPFQILSHHSNVGSTTENQMEDLLDNNVPISLRNSIWYQHDVKRNEVRWYNLSFNNVIVSFII